MFLKKPFGDQNCVDMLIQYFNVIGLKKGNARLEINGLKCSAILAILAYSCCAGVYTSLKSDDFDDTTIVLLFFSMAGHTLLVYVTFLYRQTSVFRILDILKSEFEHFEDKLLMTKSNSWEMHSRRTAEQYTHYSMLMILACVVHVSQRFLHPSELWERKLIYPQRFPFPLNNFLAYFVGLSYQVLVLTLVIVLNGTSLLMIASSANLYMSLTISLNRVFKNIRRHAIFKIPPLLPRTDDKQKESDCKDYYILKCCIKNDQLIKR